MAYAFENAEWSWRHGDERRPLTDFTRGRPRAFYLYDLDHLDERARLMTDRLDARVHYAVKANADPRVLDVLRARGLGVDVVSLGELQLALERGFKPERIIYSGVAKDRDELTLAVDHGIYQINVESFDELRVLGQVARDRHRVVDLGLRVNIDLDAPTHRHIQTATATSKFGLSLELLPEVLEWLRARPQLRLKGLAVHIGSQILDVDAFREMSTRVGRLYRGLRAEAPELRRLDLGGGLGLDYRTAGEDDVARLELYKDAIRAHGTDAEISVEPGRFLTARMGVLLAKVVYVKDAAAGKFLILNAGMNALMRPMLYEAYHRIEPLRARAGAPDVYTVVGPICESTDVLGESRVLPPMEAGDWVAVFDAGAYGAVMANTYNENPLPERWSVRGGRLEVI